MGNMQSQAQYVLRTVEERGVRFVQLWFTDVLGRHKAFHVTPAELEDALDQGMTFDGSAIDGFSRTTESDLLARPDLTTFQLLPGTNRVKASPGCSATSSTSTARPLRGVPASNFDACWTAPSARGTPSSSRPKSSTSTSTTSTRANVPVPIDRGSYFDLTPDDIASQLRRRTVLTLEEMGIGVEHAQHEDAPGQHEIDLRYTDALTMADTVMSLRHVVKELARQSGIAASFMPKPLVGVQGSGMHTHLSLWRDDKNAFIGEHTYGLSDLAAKFIAGSCATRPRSRRSPTSGSTPTSVSSPASKPRSASSGLATTRRPSCACPP